MATVVLPLRWVLGRRLRRLCSVAIFVARRIRRTAVMPYLRSTRTDANRCSRVGIFCRAPADGRFATCTARGIARRAVACAKALAPGQRVRFGRFVAPGKRSAVGWDVAVVHVSSIAWLGHASESVDRPRFRRVPKKKYKYLLGKGAQYMDRSTGYFRRVAEETDSSLVRAAAKECEFTCEAVRMPFTPYAPSGRGLSAPVIRPEGSVTALGIMITSEAVVAPAAPKVSTTPCNCSTAAGLKP